jgi:hypothetical protein
MAIADRRSRLEDLPRYGTDELLLTLHALSVAVVDLEHRKREVTDRLAPRHRDDNEPHRDVVRNDLDVADRVIHEVGRMKLGEIACVVITPPPAWLNW